MMKSTAFSAVIVLHMIILLILFTRTQYLVKACGSILLSQYCRVRHLLTTKFRVDVFPQVPS